MKIRHPVGRRHATVVVVIAAIALTGAFTALAASISVSPSHVDRISDLPGPPSASVTVVTDPPATDPGTSSPLDSDPPTESSPGSSPGSVPSSESSVVESSTTTP